MFKMSFLHGGVSGVDVGALGWLYGLAVFRELATTGFSSSAADVLERINAARGQKLTLGEVVQGVYEHNVRPVRCPLEYEFKNELVRSVFSARIQKFLPNKTQARRIMRALNATELTPPEG